MQVLLMMWPVKKKKLIIQCEIELFYIYTYCLRDCKSLLLCQLSTDDIEQSGVGPIVPEAIVEKYAPLPVNESYNN